MMMIAVLLGLLVGSFLNVLIVRIPKMESIVYPASHCVSCNHKLAAIDLVPVVSYIMLCGKCRYCGAKISPRYTVVEVLMGVLAACSYSAYGLSLEFFASFVFQAILIVAAVIDIEHKIIPDVLVVAGTAVGVILIIYSIFHKVAFYDVWYSPLVGMMLVPLVLYVLSWLGGKIYKVDYAIGLGDVALFIPIGMIIGYKKSLVALIIAVFLGGFYGIYLILKDRKNSKREVPFAPFISVGSVISMYLGHEILVWYVNNMLVGGRF